MDLISQCHMMIVKKLREIGESDLADSYFKGYMKEKNMALNVQEMIEQLQAVKDKTKLVVMENLDSWSEIQNVDEDADCVCIYRSHFTAKRRG